MRQMQRRAVERDPDPEAGCASPPQTRRCPVCRNFCAAWPRCRRATWPTSKPGLYPAPREDEGWLDRIAQRPGVLCRCAGGGAAAGGKAPPGSARGAAGRQAAALLPAELPLPDRWLDERAFSAALRHAGRGAVHRRDGGHAAHGPGAGCAVDEGPRPAHPAGGRPGHRPGQFRRLRWPKPIRACR
jgi:hypothetical protein